MADYGELNVGQLVREHYGPEAVLIGFTTYTGTVTAASDWIGRQSGKRVRPALGNSYEHHFMMLTPRIFFCPCATTGPASNAVRDPRLERAIGVIYMPQTERQSHYFKACLSDQFGRRDSF